ncbi:MAG: metallophosphoesterase family protein [Myxococcota bacterium]
MARPTEDIATVALPAEGPARIVVVADTHGKPHPAIGERLAALRPAAILHAGDIGDLGVLDQLGAYAPVLAVRGNIDGAAPGVPDQRVIDVQGGASGTLRILLVHIAVYGPRIRAEVARAAKDVGAALVVCGHSHVPFIGADRGLTVFNPGSIGPRRFSLPIVFGTIEFTGTGVKLAHVDCETGAPWRPPA